MTRSIFKGFSTPILMTLGLLTSQQVAAQEFVDMSDPLQTDTFSFGGRNDEAGDTNDNYYDGDFGDFDGDGLLDRALISRYGLLLNTGGGLMTPVANTIAGGTYEFGDKDAVGNDAVIFVDVDNDGDLDTVQGGNGESLVLQLNEEGSFRVRWRQGGMSAKRMIKIDLENDGDVDLIVAGAFCLTRNCGQPDDFSLLVNRGDTDGDRIGDGEFDEAASARGLPLASALVAGVASGDIDGDGDYDLMIVSGERREVIAYLNDGNGFFTERPVYDIPDEVWSYQMSIGMSGSDTTALGDLDGDGDLDFVVAAHSPFGSHPNVAHAVFINDGAGNFSEESASRIDVGGFEGFLAGREVKLVDLDHDGDLDMVTYQQFTMFGDNRGNHLQLFRNDGNGFFTFVTQGIPAFTPPSGGINSFDVADYTGDGSLDLWLGNEGGRVLAFVNTYEDPSGLPADQPRNLRVRSAGPGGIELAWNAPPSASTVRSYRVYRSTAAGLPLPDRRLIKHVARSAHADEGFVAPIAPSTTTAELGDPDVSLDGANGEIRFTDRSAAAGIRYFYSVTHVGNETKESAPAAEVSGQVPAVGGADGEAPELHIEHPTAQHGSPFPRVVLHFADGGSGIDLDSLSVSFDAPVGNRSAGANLRDLGVVEGQGHFVAFLAPPFRLPSNQLVSLTASISDNAGNTATTTRRFVVRQEPPALPSASFTMSANAGEAPFTVDFDGGGSSDADGKIVRWEWIFGDGSTAIGRTVRHTYLVGGRFDAMLVVRDNEGGVATATRSIEVMGDAPQCAGDESRGCYGGPPGTDSIGECTAGTQTCMGGAWSACAGATLPAAEACDGRDDDCDGRVDEDWAALGDECTRGVGSCERWGTVACAPDGASTVCNAEPGTPGEESCDGANDEDCDGTVDEGCPCDGGTRRCYAGPARTQGIGACVPGMQTCVSGAWGGCEGQVLPSEEICDDRLDNDCDGLADEGDTECSSPPDDPSRNGASAGSVDAGAPGPEAGDGEGAGGGGGCGIAGPPQLQRLRLAAVPVSLSLLALWTRRRRRRGSRGVGG